MSKFLDTFINFFYVLTHLNTVFYDHGMGLPYWRTWRTTTITECRRRKRFLNGKKHLATVNWSLRNLNTGKGSTPRSLVCGYNLMFPRWVHKVLSFLKTTLNIKSRDIPCFIRSRLRWRMSQRGDRDRTKTVDESSKEVSLELFSEHDLWEKA